MTVREIEIHPGHWKNPNSGANGILNEVTEARKVAKRVYDLLRSWQVPATYFEDNTSTNQTQNINTLVKEHNKDRDGLIVSIHFNASAGTQNRGIGTEVLYYDQKALASSLSKAISDATNGELLNRGAKQRKDIGVLASTYEPAVLIEVCFVNSTVDAVVYRRDFEKICHAIAKELAAYLGRSVPSTSSSVEDKKEELSVSAEEKLQKQIDELKELVKSKANVKSESEVAASHKEAWEWAINEGIIKGDGTSLNPAGVVTRQQMATMLKRYHDKFNK